MQRFQRLKFFTKYALSNELNEKSLMYSTVSRSFSQSEKRIQPKVKILDSPPLSINLSSEIEEKIVFNVEKNYSKEIEKVNNLFDNRILIFFLKIKQKSTKKLFIQS